MNERKTGRELHTKEPVPISLNKLNVVSEPNRVRKKKHADNSRKPQHIETVISVACLVRLSLLKMVRIVVLLLIEFLPGW